MRRRHHISFKHAWDGIIWVFRTQPNFRFHSLAAVAVIALSVFLSLPKHEILTLAFTIMLVIVAEMINTAIESITDLVTTEYKHQAKIAKDVSAGMVLLTAALSVIIGIFIFLPYIIN